MVKIKRIRASGRIPLELLENIRRPDLKELMMGALNPEEAVRQSINDSRYCYAVRDKDNRLLAVFGIGKVLVNVSGTMATPIWFLGTNWAYRHNKAMVFHGKQFCARFIEDVGPLCNFIWAGNEPAIRYIQHLGAALYDVAPMGKHGELFVPFLLSEVK